MKKTMLNPDFNFRFDTSRIAANHLLTSLGEWEYGGWRCTSQKLSGTRRFGVAKFDMVALSTISNRNEWQTAAFPAHDTPSGDHVIDFGHPICGWGGTIPAGEPTFAEMIEQVYEVTCDCSKPEREIAYLMAYIER